MPANGGIDAVIQSLEAVDASSSAAGSRQGGGEKAWIRERLVRKRSSQQQDDRQQQSPPSREESATTTPTVRGRVLDGSLRCDHGSSRATKVSSFAVVRVTSNFNTSKHSFACSAIWGVACHTSRSFSLDSCAVASEGGARLRAGTIDPQMMPLVFNEFRR